MTGFFFRAACFVGLIGLCCSALAQDHIRQNSQPIRPTVSEGHAIFVRTWSPGDSFESGGDGLGPLFNDRSCVACHHQGTTGGGGSVEKNIDLLFNASEDKLSAQRQLAKFHSGFVSELGDLKSSIILHRFGMDREYALRHEGLLGYTVSEHSGAMDGKQLQRDLEIRPVHAVSPKQNLHLLRTQRNSTALFGSGLIDQIPDEAIIELAVRQQFGNVSGRPSTLPNPSGMGPAVIGRFGWRAQTATLHDFVQDACATEIGLELANRKQTPDPRRPRYRPEGVDLTNQQVTSLTMYVGNLQPPMQVIPEDEESKAVIKEGRRLFTQIGCATCHVESIGPVEGIYSDLLLHNMGPNLADPVPAPEPVSFNRIVDELSELIPKSNKSAPSGSSYGGGSAKPRGKGPVVNATGKDTKTKVANKSTNQPSLDESLAIRQQEWRTPPLWGVADSAPYLHDGRAKTLLEAIAYHGGEASNARNSYFRISVDSRRAVISFLETLQAPN